MSTDDVKANYTAAGIDIIELMYEDDYLSIGGNESTRSLAQAAGIREDCRVLDVGCGLGGPAMFLAEHYGCHVTGLDLVDINITAAQTRAARRGLQASTDFIVGDAVKLPFEDLITQCARVLEKGGTLAFTDWLVIGEMNAQQKAAVLEASASPEMTTPQTYRDLLAESNLKVVEPFITQYQQVMAGLPSIQATISERFSPKVYEIIRRKNQDILDGFVSGGIGGARFIATKL